MLFLSQTIDLGNVNHFILSNIFRYDFFWSINAYSIPSDVWTFNFIFFPK